jgi:hypothetical protein
MIKPNIVAELSSHQKRILANFEATKTLVADGNPIDVKGLVRLRGDLIRLLTAYQHFKHHSIFNVLIAEGPDAKARIGRRLKAECISLGEEVRHHVHSWTDSGLERSWLFYRPALLQFLDRVKAHMNYELAAAHAVLNDDDALPPAPPPLTAAPSTNAASI